MVSNFLWWMFSSFLIVLRMCHISVQVNSRHLRLGANRRATIIDEMENSAPMVIEVIQAYMGMLNDMMCGLSCVKYSSFPAELADEQLMVKIFKCLGSWLYLGVFPGNHVARQNLLQPPFQVLVHTKCSGVDGKIHHACFFTG